MKGTKRARLLSLLGLIVFSAWPSLPALRPRAGACNAGSHASRTRGHDRTRRD